MAVWARFAPGMDLTALARRCEQLGLGLNDGQLFQTANEPHTAHLRLGFASSNSDELTQSVEIMVQALRMVRSDARPSSRQFR